MTLDLPYRPILQWPGQLTEVRIGSPFYATWPQTKELLERELRHLGARNQVLQIAVTEMDFRQDGRLYAGAKPEHPGVILSFDSRFGPLQYACDRFTDWQSNVRAIALSLEALRKVDRYGVSTRGEQYTGWKALADGASTGLHVTALNREEAMSILRALSAWPENEPFDVERAVRRAAKQAHPDVAGDREAWDLLQRVKAVLSVGVSA